MSKRTKRTAQQQQLRKEVAKQRDDALFQEYLRNIQWSDDPRKNIEQLRRLAQELEYDLDYEGIEYTQKIYAPEDIRQARKWFKEEVKRLLANPWEVDHKRMSKYTRRQPAISLPQPHDIGRMFFYGYNPKTKDTLPYYDILPLIIMVKGLDDGWHGLNLHYLPPKQREILIYRLMEVMSDTKLDNYTRLKINYNLLSNVAKYRYFKPCFKRYLKTHVRSSVRPIPFRHWPKAILLPVAKFKKASITTVWADSLKIARGIK